MWKHCTLEEVCSATQGAQISKSNQISNARDGYKRYLYISDFKHDKNLKYVEDIYPKKIVTTNDIIVSNTGSQGEVYRGINGILSNNLFKVSFDNTVLDKEFLFYFLKSPLFIDFQNERTRGSTQPHMGHKNFLSTPFSLPPLAEQQRIVAKLDAAFAEIDTAIAAAGHKSDEISKLYENSTSAVFTTIKNYTEKKLSDVCEKITDGTHQTPKYFDSGYIFLSSKNVTTRKIDWDNVRYIDEAQHIQMHKRIAPKIGDVLLAKNGTTGVAAIVDRDVVFDIYVSLAWLRSKGEVEPEYLLEYVNSKMAREQFNMRTKGIGVPNLHLQEIREVVIRFPANKEVQVDIVRKLKSIDDACKAFRGINQKKLQTLTSLKSSILAQELQSEAA